MPGKLKKGKREKGWMSRLSLVAQAHETKNKPERWMRHGMQAQADLQRDNALRPPGVGGNPSRSPLFTVHSGLELGSCSLPDHRQGFLEAT